MDEYADIYYVDTRNADSRDHRTQGGIGGRPSVPANWRPSSGSAPMAPSRTVYVNPAPVAYPQGYVPAGYPRPFPGAPGYPPQNGLAGLFGSMTTGQVVDMVAMLFAAIQPLPAAPTATKDTATDVGNLILYQGALAQHAKRDEQVRTLGGLVSRLVG